MEHTLTTTLNRQAGNPHGGACSCGGWSTKNRLVPEFVRQDHSRHVEQVRGQNLDYQMAELLDGAQPAS